MLSSSYQPLVNNFWEDKTMNATAPTAAATSFVRRPAVRGALRALNIVGGLITAAAALVCIGFYAVAAGCVGDETTGLSVQPPALVPVLEWAIVATGVGAPLAGGIAAYVRREPVWLLAGVLTAVAMGFAIFEVSA